MRSAALPVLGIESGVGALVPVVSVQNIQPDTLPTTGPTIHLPGCVLQSL